MTDIQKFQNGPLDAEVRVFVIDGRVWFVLSDLARVLGYRDASNAVRLLRDKQWMYAPDDIKKALGVRGSAPYLATEGGFYRLAMRSSRAEAEPFQEWVEDDVLPSIREEGGYIRSDATMEQVEALKEQHRLELEKAQRKVDKVIDYTNKYREDVDKDANTEVARMRKRYDTLLEAAVKQGLNPRKLPIL